MDEIPLHKIDSRFNKQIEAAKKALATNPQYTVDLCSNILKHNIACLDLRKILRQAQFKVADSQKGGLLKKFTSTPFSVVNASAIAKDPEKSMEQAEKMITQNPSRFDAHSILGKAAKELGLKNTAAFAFETVCKLKPEDMPNLKELAYAYIEMGKTKEAIQLGELVAKKMPSDGEAQEIVKLASINQSLQKGKWEEKGDFRDKLKDEDEAVSLEQSSRVVQDDDTLLELITAMDATIEAEPDNMSHYKTMAGYYQKLGDFQTAIDWIQYSRSLPGGNADVTLEQYQNKLQQLLYKNSLDAKTAEVEADPENQELAAELEEIKQAEFQFLLTTCQDMVSRYPNDFMYRFEYGKLLLESGDSDSCIEQFQLAQRNPKVKNQAILFLGQAYKKKGLYDLAIDQFTLVKKEILTMDALKKEAIYELASCLELQGKTKESVDEFKIIYSIDIGYKDVSKKIDAFYSAATPVTPAAPPPPPAPPPATPITEIPATTDRSAAEAAYTEAVEIVWLDGKLAKPEKEYLDAKVKILNLSEEVATKIEESIMGFPRDSAAFQYKEIVKIVWLDKILAPAEKDYLDSKVKELALDDAYATEIENEIMGFSRDKAPS